MGDSSGMSEKVDDSGVLELTGKIMVVGVFVLFLVVLVVFSFHRYAKWFWNRRREDSPNTITTTRRRRRFDFAPGYQELNVVTALRRGLEPSVLKTIPVVMFSAKDFKDGLECAVCLSEVSEGEKASLLPKCNHGFHVECINMWFQSHSTCPLCRNPISNQSSLSSAGPESSLGSIIQAPMHVNTAVNGYSTELPNFPTNVLFWGNETHVSTLGNTSLEEGNRALSSSQPPASSNTSSSPSSLSTSTNNRPNGTLVIDIPRQINEDEEPKSSMPTRLRSLKRLLSRDRRVSPLSPGDFDVEQQGDRGQSQ